MDDGDHDDGEGVKVRGGGGQNEKDFHVGGAMLQCLVCLDVEITPTEKLHWCDKQKHLSIIDMYGVCAIDKCSTHTINICLSIINMFGVYAIDRCSVHTICMCLSIIDMYGVCAINRCSGLTINIRQSIIDMYGVCAIDWCSEHTINMFGVCAINRCSGLNNCVENVILIIVNLALYHFMAVPYECIYI